MVKTIKKFFNNLKILGEIRQLKIERSQLEHYDGVEKNDDPGIYERYKEINREIEYLVEKIK